VLSISSVHEGPFLADNTGSDTTLFVGNSALLYENGYISGGLSESIFGAATSTDSSGVVATLYFTVVGYGTSAVSITGTGNGAAYLLASNTDSSHYPVTATNDGSVDVETPPLSISLLTVPTSLNPTPASSIIEPSNTSPITDAFSLEAYVSGAVGNIWGWSLNVAWNPAVLEMVPSTSLNPNPAEGTYLSGYPAQTGATTLFLPGNINNVAGTIEGGTSDAYSSITSSTAPAGVLMTLNFKVIGYGSSAITITDGLPSGALFSLGSGSTLFPGTTQYNANPITCSLNNFQYTWNAPPPTQPTAAITVDNSPFGPTSDNTFTGYGITLDSATSTPGVDEEPPNTVCPITGYSWSVTLVDGQTVTATTPTLALTDAQIGEVAGVITATLYVTAPVPAGASLSLGYDPTSATTTLLIQVETPYPGGVLDIWTQNGGNGPNVDASSFGPQQIVDLYAYVSYNGAPVVDKTVTFAISGPDVPGGTVYVTAQSDQSGLAIAQYRLPWQDSDPTNYFGEMTVSGSVDVAQVILTDTCNFYYGYQLDLNSVVITNGGTYNRYGMTGPDSNNMVDATVSVTNTMWFSQQFWISAVIYDNNNVAVAQCLVEETAPAATATPNTWANSYTQGYSISLTIPTWAYVGTATLYVNIFNSTSANALTNPIAWSPQVQAPLVITANYPNNVIPPSATQPAQVLNVDFTVQNDEDSGYAAGYWALDNYVQTVQVWSLGGTQYEAVQTFKGTFTTYAGALSPQNGVSEPNTETGTLVGEIVSTFSATSFNPSNYVVYGNLGTKNYGGTEANVLLGTYALQGSGDATPYNWFTAYFAGVPPSGAGSLDNVNWGFTYTITSGTSLVWNNNAALNTGDIIT
jgi:hypothetical protein